MIAAQPILVRIAFCLALAASVSLLVSIAASQILTALALAALLAGGGVLRLPPVRLPLALFMAATVVSLWLSEDPSAGRPQIRKFYVFLTLLVVYSAFPRLDQVRRWLFATAAVATLSSVLALAQFVRIAGEARQAGRGFYEYYVADRITGFMSHWMTFGGQVMIALLMLAAWLAFAPLRRRTIWLVCALVLSAALLLGFTRGIWLATIAGGVYLVWFRDRRLLLAAPVALAALLLLAPSPVRDRFTSLFRPSAQLDSNQHRIVCLRTGWRMIQAHPWFGVGPEHVRIRFQRYLPADAPNPLPPGWYGHLHNNVVHLAAERGAPAALAMLWLVGKILWDLLRALRRLAPDAGERRAVLHGSVSVVIAVMVAGLFEYNLGDSEVLALFLTVVGCGYVAAESDSAQAGALA